MRTNGLRITAKERKGLHKSKRDNYRVGRRLSSKWPHPSAGHPRVTSRECKLFPRGAKETVSISTEQKETWKGTSVATQSTDVKPEGKVPEHATLTRRRRL